MQLAPTDTIEAIKVRMPINTDVQIVLKSKAAIGVWKGPTGIAVLYRIEAKAYANPVGRKAVSRRVFKDGAVERISREQFLATLETDAPVLEVFLGSVARRLARTFVSLDAFMRAFEFNAPRLAV